MIFCENTLLNILIRHWSSLIPGCDARPDWMREAGPGGVTWSHLPRVSRVTCHEPRPRWAVGLANFQNLLYESRGTSLFLFFLWLLTFWGNRGIGQLGNQNCLCRSKLKFEIMFVSAGRGMACSANHSKGSGHGSSSAHGAQHGGGLIVGPGAWLQRKVHLRPQHRGVHLVTDEILRGVSSEHTPVRECS